MGGEFLLIQYAASILHGVMGVGEGSENSSKFLKKDLQNTK